MARIPIRATFVIRLCWSIMSKRPTYVCVCEKKYMHISVERDTQKKNCISFYIYIYVKSIYVHIYVERDTQKRHTSLHSCHTYARRVQAAQRC